MAVAHDRIGAAAGLDDHVGKDQVRVDLHRGDVGDVDRLLLGADPAGRVLDHAGGRDGDLRRKEMIAAGPAAGPEHVAGGERAALAVDHPQQQHPQHDDGDRRVQRPGFEILTIHGRPRVPNSTASDALECAMPSERAPAKRELLDALRSSRDAVLATVRALPPEALEHGGYENGWNGRQILAHLASIEWTYPRLIDIARDAGAAAPAAGEPPTRSMRGGNDAYNERQVAKRAQRSVA